ncbi:MAG: Uma2 family endonuclease [Polyangiaceae bacterium]
MALSATKQAPPIPVTPSVEEWRAMSPSAQLDFQLRVIDALNASADVMGEGRPHKKAKSRALDALGLHFKAIGRSIYLAEEMTVLYPGAVAFIPDILAVVGVDEPEEDERMSWVVADEGRGLDLVIEVLYKGDREKDLVDNVERYAQLGIPEYFVFDRLRLRIHGYRLTGPGRYQPILPQYGRYHSDVLGLDMVLVGNSLRFLVGEAELPGSDNLIGRLHGMVQSVSTRAEQAEAKLGEVEALAIAGILAVFQARGLTVSDAARERINNEHDVLRLRRWMEKALTAASVEEALSDDPPNATPR